MMPSLDSRQERSGKHRLDRTGEPAESTSQIKGGGHSRRKWWMIAGLLFASGTVVGITSQWWWPDLQFVAHGHSSTVDDHGHEQDAAMASGTAAAQVHNHAASETTLTLSQQGLKNIGLTLATVSLQDFSRTVSMPASVVGRPGRSDLSVSAPMTGIVTRIYPMRGEAVLPGAPLFELRLTHQDLVEKQSALLRSLEELDVEKQEVARLDKVTASGAVAGKRLLERQYEQKRIEATLRASRQALLLHGLTEDQIQQIVDTRQLLQALTINAPPPCDGAGSDEHVDYLQVAEIDVKMGEHVATGTQLALVTDHCELLVEGKAFEQDAEALNQAANDHAGITALISATGAETQDVSGLQILYVENRVERDSRALNFYVRLPNELVRNEASAGGHRFIGWRYRPGQRVELLVPVERWEKCVVLPIEAIVQEGPESYVYVECSGHFERKAVHVQYRDQRSAVIESDGTLFPGDKVAAQGANQIHLAAKNKAGGGVDPHAGHHH